jgi:isopentenyl diphosphate isomerase/L-lactate dehydrogenase-like FMN-dependent dehydrogenase
MARRPDFANHRELRDAARRVLPRFMFEFVDGGAEDEVGVAANRSAFERIKILPRVLVDVTVRDLSVTIFGRRWTLPIAIAPAGAAAMLWYRGEAELSRAAAAAGVPHCLSGGSSLAIEEALAANPGTWFQLYVWKDLALTHRVIDRMAAAGAEALIITADTPAAPIREYNARNGFTVPFSFNATNLLDILRRPGWARRVALRYRLGPGLPRYENVPPEMRVTVAGRPVTMTPSSSFDWQGFREIRRRWKGPLLLKGVMHAADASAAVAAGADGVIVSNHGGRNLDSAPATLDVLPGIADAVGGRATVLLDGGIRRGSDVFKALALGADAVLAGRMPLFAVAVSGAPAVAHLFARWRVELDTVMAMAGARTINEIDRGRLG